eukprot:scaffold626_cov337-Pavlova_lutheri.AAC.4
MEIAQVSMPWRIGFLFPSPPLPLSLFLLLGGAGGYRRGGIRDERDTRRYRQRTRRVSEHEAMRAACEGCRAAEATRFCVEEGEGTDDTEAEEGGCEKGWRRRGGRRAAGIR